MYYTFIPMKVSSVAVTKSLVTDGDRELTPDELIVYEARVSNPSNQHNHETGPGLLNFLSLIHI